MSVTDNAAQLTDNSPFGLRMTMQIRVRQRRRRVALPPRAQTRAKMAKAAAGGQAATQTATRLSSAIVNAGERGITPRRRIGVAGTIQ